jgi:hypothetical protein
MYEQHIHVHHSLLQVCQLLTLKKLKGQVIPALESKLSTAKAPDHVPNVALMLFRQRLQSICRCSVVTASVPLTLVPSLEPCRRANAKLHR